jgi:RNA polymerase sigma-70 factor (ECF subfamily)
MDADSQRAILSDALRRVAAGDRAALHEVYRRTSAKLFGVVLRILHDRAEAEDVLQEVYLNVWRKAAQFDADKASPITWLAAMARNRAIDRARVGGGRTFVSDDAVAQTPDAAPLASEQMQTAEEAQAIDGCIEQLEPAHGQAVRQAFFGGLTYDVLARQAEVPLGTMKGWIRRSLMKLKACLGEAYA